MQLFLTREGQQARGEAGGAFNAVHGCIKHGANIRIAFCQLPSDDRDRGIHHRQHIVEVMRYAACQLAHRFHFLRLM